MAVGAPVLRLEIVGRREMVGMRMGVEDPLDAQALARDICEDRVGVGRGGRAGLLVEIEHRIDDGAAAASADRVTTY